VVSRRRSAVLWGLVGTLTFLVGHQAYLLLDGVFLGFGVVVGVAIFVGLTTTVVAYAFEGRLRRRRTENG
jgi:hypothetical protein